MSVVVSIQPEKQILMAERAHAVVFEEAHSSRVLEQHLEVRHVL